MAVLNPMLEAVVAALNGDAQLPALITGVYSGRAPAAAIMDYLVIVDMNAGGLSRFAAGQIDRGEFSIRIWTRDFSSAAILYDHVKRILHRQKIVVAGASVVVAGG